MIKDISRMSVDVINEELDWWIKSTVEVLKQY